MPGQNVRLTIDTELQAVAQQALIDQLNQLNTAAKRIVSQQGVVIAMDPRSGEILALVSYPGYDNTRFSRVIDGEYYLDLIDDPLRPLVNNTIKSKYPPGSVWKVITAAAVVEENVIDPNTQLLDEGSLLLENRYAPNDPAASQRFVCWLRSGHGRVNLLQGIAWSCDVYFYQIGGGNPDLSPQTLRPGGLGIEDLFRYATALGIGSELGIELPFENPGRMPDRDWKRRNQGENWSTGDTYNAAFGQGYVDVTPLQLIAAVSATINGGVLYQPTIIRDFLDEERRIIEPFEAKILRTINREAMSPNEELTLLLPGTAEYCDDIANSLNLCVPGQWPAHAWFTGYAPSENPEVIILAFAYNGGEGSQVALPIVKRTMEAYFRLKNEREGLALSESDLRNER